MVESILTQSEIESERFRCLELVKTYFQEDSLNGFSRHNDDCLRLDSPYMDRGYVFVYAQQSDRDHERKMAEEIKLTEGLGRHVQRKFTDYSGDLSGFYWRK